MTNDLYPNWVHDYELQFSKARMNYYYECSHDIKNIIRWESLCKINEDIPQVSYKDIIHWFRDKR